MFSRFFRREEQSPERRAFEAYWKAEQWRKAEFNKNFGNNGMGGARLLNVPPFLFGGTAPQNPQILNEFSGLYRPTATNTDLDRLYSTGVAVYSAANVRANNIAFVKWELVDDDDQPVTNDLSRMLLSPHMSDIMRRTELSLSFRGHSLIWIRRNLFNGLPSALQWINFNLYTADRQPIEGLVGFRVVSRASTSEPIATNYIDREDAIYVHGVDFWDDFDGVSPAEVAFMPAGVDVETYTTAMSFFQNMAIPALVIQPIADDINGMPLPEDVDDLRRLLNRLTKGVVNAGRTIVTPKRWEYQQLQGRFDELDMTNVRNDAIDGVFMAFGVPREIVQPTEGNYAQTVEARRSWIQTWLIPQADWYADQLTEQLIEPLTDHLHIRPNFDRVPFHKEDQAKRIEMVNAKVQAGYMTLYQAQLETDTIPDKQLEGVYKIGDLPVPGHMIPQMYAKQQQLAASGAGSGQSGNGTNPFGKNPFGKINISGGGSSAPKLDAGSNASQGMTSRADIPPAKSLITLSEWLPDEAYKELQDWRRIVARKGVEYDFQASFLPPGAVAFGKALLTGGADVDDTFNQIRNNAIHELRATKFDPNQQRDSTGKWSSTGGGNASSANTDKKESESMADRHTRERNELAARHADIDKKINDLEEQQRSLQKKAPTAFPHYDQPHSNPDVQAVYDERNKKRADEDKRHKDAVEQIKSKYKGADGKEPRLFSPEANKMQGELREEDNNFFNNKSAVNREADRKTDAINKRIDQQYSGLQGQISDLQTQKEKEVTELNKRQQQERSETESKIRTKTEQPETERTKEQIGQPKKGKVIDKLKSLDLGNMSDDDIQEATGGKFGADELIRAAGGASMPEGLEGSIRKSRDGFKVTLDGDGIHAERTIIQRSEGQPPPPSEYNILNEGRPERERGFMPSPPPEKPPSSFLDNHKDELPPRPGVRPFKPFDSPEVQAYNEKVKTFNDAANKLYQETEYPKAKAQYDQEKADYDAQTQKYRSDLAEWNAKGPERRAKYNQAVTDWQKQKEDYQKSHESQWTIHNDLFEIDSEMQGSGLGTSIFASQVANASDLGFKSIETHAARSEGQYNGYYTWPRLGYDSELDEDMASSVKADFPEFEDKDTLYVSDLMKTSDGREWWKKNGDSLPHARFDLSPNSISRKVLDAYVKAKGINVQ